MSSASFDKNVRAVAKVVALVVERHRGYTADNHPMLVSVLVALQAQTLTGVDHQPLDFGAARFVKDIKAAPGPVCSVAIGHYSSSLFHRLNRTIWQIGALKCVKKILP